MPKIDNSQSNSKSGQRPNGTDHPHSIHWDALSLPKHRRLQFLLEDQIRRGVYGPGSRLPTEKELIAEHDLSHATVSRAMRQLTQAGLVTRKRKCGTFVAQKPTTFTAVPGAAYDTIGLFHRFHWTAGFHPYFHILLKDFTLAAESQGMRAKIVEIGPEEIKVDEHFLEQNGIIGCALLGEQRKETIQNAIRLKIPLVSFSNSWANMPIDRVTVDTSSGLHQAAKHFHAAGHKRIVVIDAFASSIPIKEVVAEEYDCLPSEAPVDQLTTLNYGEQGAVAALAWLQALPERPTALYVSDDFLLLHLLRVAARAGLEAPRDFSIIGYGTTSSPQLLGAGVSLVEYDPDELAKGAMLLLVEQIRERRTPGKSILIPTRLVLRQSG